MKRINELKQERAQLIKDMQALVDTASTEKRSQNEDEVAKWNEKNDRVGAIDGEVKTLERQEALNLSIVSDSNKDDETTVAKRYDLSKAIAEARSGNLTGLEAEMHQEAKSELRGTSGVIGNLYIPSILLRANEMTKNTGGNAGHIPTAVGNLDVVAPTPLYRELGATVYENLSNGKLELPFSKGHSAGRVAEEGNAVQSVPTKAKGSLTAARFQGWQKYTQEYLAESAVLPAMMADMVASIDRAVGKDLIGAANLANILDGFEDDATEIFLDYEGILGLMAALDNDDFSKEGLIMSKQLFYHLAATPKLTTVSSVGSDDVVTSTGNFIVDLISKGKGRVAGVDSVGTSFLPLHSTNQYDVVYGDWSKSFVGFWGGVQLLVDPYSSSDSGEVKITFSRMADTAVNPYAFASKRNIKIA